MPKTAAIICIAIALGIAFIFLAGKADAPEMAPIVDEPCEAGYTRLGEGCVPFAEECEARGDPYHYDESQQKCLVR